MSLLVIDFDFFFPTPDPRKDTIGLWDWAQKESRFLIEVIWDIRASQFLRLGELPQTSGEQAGFWDRFTFAPGAQLFVSESNAQSASTRIADVFGYPSNGEPPEEVWLYDAHHDAGYGCDYLETIDQGEYSCENWTFLWSALGSELHMRYPRWKDYAFDIEPEPAIDIDRQFDAPDNGPEVAFDAVHVCRSGAWVPTWLDDDFFQFLDDAPFSTSIDLMADRYPLTKRAFDLVAATAMASDLDEMISLVGKDT